MVPHAPSAPVKIRIWQQNAHKSGCNTNYILNQANPVNYNIILIQEPWFNHLGKTCGTHNWCIIYPPTIYHNNHSIIWSIMLISTNISTNTYSTLNIQSSDITTIHLKGTLWPLPFLTSITAQTIIQQLPWRITLTPTYTLQHHHPMTACSGMVTSTDTTPSGNPMKTTTSLTQHPWLTYS